MIALLRYPADRVATGGARHCACRPSLNLRMNWAGIRHCDGVEVRRHVDLFGQKKSLPKEAFDATFAAAAVPYFSAYDRLNALAFVPAHAGIFGGDDFVSFHDNTPG